MDANTDYKINKVEISTNGRNEIYLDIEWEGDNQIEYYEIQVLDRHRKWVGASEYVAHNHRIVITDYQLGLAHKELRAEAFHVELGYPEFNDEGQQVCWKVLAAYEPIFVNLYHEARIFHRNLLEIRKPEANSPKLRSEEHRESYLSAPRVIVAGSRNFFDYDLMKQELDRLFIEARGFAGHDIKIISGMADGADTLAIRYADERKLTKILFPANWKKYSRAAGFLRNEDMLSVATHLVVFWDGISSGTNHMIEIAKAKDIPIWGLKHPCSPCMGEFRLERWN